MARAHLMLPAVGMCEKGSGHRDAAPRISG
jgi:hypothetical protein